jgi:aminoglycoside phosphotransferase family enzyme/predicted kinase
MGGTSYDATALARELSRPFALPCGEPVERVIETHTALVLMTARDVYKIKKAVLFGFLDFSTLEARRAACEAELVLNRRTAPDVYLAVLPVKRGADGRATLTGAGPTVDYAVRMVRLKDADCASHRLARGALGPEEIDRLAATLARFHDGCVTDARTQRLCAVDALAANVRDNFRELPARADVLSAHARAGLEEWQLSTLVRDAERFSRRAASGRARDGHGDLRLEHVYFTGAGVRVLDCVEFSDRYRVCDVASDVAFLSMDLSRLGRVDLAEAMLAAYARESGDYELYGVVDFYESYRAVVRAKIELIRAAQTSLSHADRSRAEASARRLLLLALSGSRPSLLAPRIVAVGGLIASGKSTVARAIGRLLSAPVLEADRVRKTLFGFGANEFHGGAPFTGIYDPRVTHRVYGEISRLARIILRSGRPVVLDASFRTRALRAQLAKFASEEGAVLQFVEVRAALDTIVARLRERQGRAQTSDARADLLAAFSARYEPVVELPPGAATILDTTRSDLPLEPRLRDIVAGWPTGICA